VHFDWIQLLATLVPLLIFLWVNRTDVKRRHDENMRQWRSLLDELSDYPPHEHMERGGALAADGIRMKRERR
jgi:hypothetical protein